MFALTSCSCTPESGKDNCHTTLSIESTTRGKSFSLNIVHSEPHQRHRESPSLELLHEEIEPFHSPCSIPSFSAARKGEEFAPDVSTTLKHYSWCTEKTSNATSRKALSEKDAPISFSLPLKLDTTLPKCESQVNPELGLEDICTVNTNSESTCILPLQDHRILSPLLQKSYPIVPPLKSTSISNLIPVQTITSATFEHKPQYPFFSSVTGDRLPRTDAEKERARIHTKFEHREKCGPVPLSGLESSSGRETSASHVDFNSCLSPRNKMRGKTSMQARNEEEVEDTPLLSFFQESRMLIPYYQKQQLIFGKQCVNSEEGTSPSDYSLLKYRLAHSCLKNKENITFSSFNKKENGTSETSTGCATFRCCNDAKSGEVDVSKSERWNTTSSELSQDREKLAEVENFIYQKDKLKAPATTYKCTKLAEESAHCPLSIIPLTSPIVTTSPTSPTSSISSTSSIFPIHTLTSSEKRFPLSELVARLPLAPEELEEMERRDHIKKNRRTVQNNNCSNLISKGKVNPNEETGKDCASNACSAGGALRSFSERNRDHLHQFFSLKNLKAHLYKALLPASPSFASPTGSTEKMLARPPGKRKTMHFGPIRPPSDLADVLTECKFLGMSDIIASVSGSSSLSEGVRGITAAVSNIEKKHDTEEKEVLESPKTAWVPKFEITQKEGAEMPESVLSTAFPCFESDKRVTAIATCSSPTLSKEIVKASTTNSIVETTSSNLHSSRLTPTQALFLAAAWTEKELHESNEQISFGSTNSGAREKVNFMSGEAEGDVPRQTDFLSFPQTTFSSLLSPITYSGEDTFSFSPFTPRAKAQSEGSPDLLCPHLDPLEHKVIFESPQSFPLRHNSSCESARVCVISAREKCEATESVNKCTPRLGQSADSYAARLTSSHCGGVLQNSLNIPEEKGGDYSHVNECGTSNTHTSKCRSTHFHMEKIVYVLHRGDASSLYCRSFHDEMSRVKDLKRYAVKAEEISQDFLRRSQTELIT